jgi:hypothetical protein
MSPYTLSKTKPPNDPIVLDLISKSKELSDATGVDFSNVIYRTFGFSLDYPDSVVLTISKIPGYKDFYIVIPDVFFEDARIDIWGIIKPSIIDGLRKS